MNTAKIRLLTPLLVVTLFFGGVAFVQTILCRRFEERMNILRDVQSELGEAMKLNRELNSVEACAELQTDNAVKSSLFVVAAAQKIGCQRELAALMNEYAKRKCEEFGWTNARPKPERPLEN